MKIRVGMGFDVHQLVEGRDLWMGGIKLEHSKGLLGHSDADVLLHAVCDALQKDDYETVGKMMYETHHGLSKEYEVSCEELDFLNDVAKEEGVTGSRIMGVGFGGCTINLVADELAANFKKVVVEKFEKKYGKKPIVIDVVIGDGARKLC